MDLTKEQKYQIEKKIITKAIDEYGKKTVTRDTLIQIADFVIEGLKKMRTTSDLSQFLSSISAKWPFFKNIATTHGAGKQTLAESEALTGALVLAQHGKVDEAIKLAKTATE